MINEAQVQEQKALFLKEINPFFKFLNEELVGLIQQLKVYNFEATSPLGRILPQIVPIATFATNRAETLLILLNAEKLWDAEIILRPILEAHIKLYYITLASSNDEQVLQKLKEYNHILSLFERKKFSDRAKEIIAEDMTLKSVFIPMVLSEEQENELISSAEFSNRDYRKQMLNKWSFPEILKSIANKFQTTSLIPLNLLNYYYKMSSHIMHGDYEAVSMIEERKSRPKVHESLASLTHTIKLGRTACEILIDIILCLYAFIGDRNNIVTCQDAVKPILKKISEQHVYLQKQAAIMGGYHNTIDDVS